MLVWFLKMKFKKMRLKVMNSTNLKIKELLKFVTKSLYYL